MQFRLQFSAEAKELLNNRKQLDPKKYQKVLKTLGLMETNLRHLSFNTHKYSSLAGANGEEVLVAYVESKTPAAFRVFWHYGPSKGIITVIAITPHP
jgi:hypothetical protein